MKKSEKVEFDASEQQTLMQALADQRNHYLSEQQPAEDVNGLFVRLVETSARKRKGDDRDER